MLFFFIGGVASIFYRAEFFCVPFILYFFLSFVVYVFCLPSNWIVFVNTWQKGGEIDEIWESSLKGFNCFLFRRRSNCFWKREKINFFYVSNLGGVSLFIVLYFLSCVQQVDIKTISFMNHNILFILFICLYFHTCVDVLFWVFQERHVHSDQGL